MRAAEATKVPISEANTPCVLSRWTTITDCPRANAVKAKWIMVGLGVLGVAA
jgi:hypothetical protein